MLAGLALDSSVLPELEALELLLLDVPEQESSDLLSSSVLSQPDASSSVVPELLDELEELLELSSLLPELLDSPEEPLKLSSAVPLLDDVAVVVSPPQL